MGIVFLFWPRAEQEEVPAHSRYFLTQEGALYRWKLFGKGLGWSNEQINHCEITPLTEDVMREVIGEGHFSVLFTILRNINLIAATHVTLAEEQLKEDRRLAGIHQTRLSFFS